MVAPRWPRTTWSPTSAPSSASTRACRSTPAASASWPATTARPPATCGLPFVGVGLLYRQGYFWQMIDNDGQQQAQLQRFRLLRPADGDGAGRQRTGTARAGRPARTRRRGQGLAGEGRARAAVPARHRPRHENSARPTATSRTGSTAATGPRASSRRSCSGVGGGRALDAMGLRPTVWHINEGHAAFLILERVRALVRAGGVDFATALEARRVEHRVHDAHGGACGPRPLRRRHDRALFRRLVPRGRRPGRAADSAWGARRPATTST